MEYRKLHYLNKKLLLLTLLVLLLTIFFVVYDIAIDVYHHAPREHVVLEVIVFSLLIGCGVLINLFLYKNELRIFTNALDKDFQILSLTERNMRISTALSASILQQFHEWGLSDSEVDVAFLLIKGFSSQEIAKARSTTEKTVREQASSIYRKSGINGRAELSAFFLEDLL